MGETALVEGRFTDASSLIRELDRRGATPTFVAWYYYDDADDWRLLVAGPRLDELLNKQESHAYREVVDALSSANTQDLVVSDVKVLKSDSPLARMINAVIGTGPDTIGRSHFVNLTVNGIFIKEIIIIRSYSER